jgi:hypothetical protein
VIGATLSTHWLFSSMLQRLLISLSPQLHVSKLNLTIFNLMTKIRVVKIVTMEEILVPKGWPSSFHLLLHLLISLFLSRIILSLLFFGGKVITWLDCLLTWNLIIFTESFLFGFLLLEPLT